LTTNNLGEVANVLNAFFVITPVKIHQNLVLNEQEENYNFQYIKESSKENDNSFFLTPVSITEVENIIKSMSSSQAQDINYISSETIKKFGTELAPILTFFINKAFENGVFPDELKIGKVIPLFKTGDKKDPNNYRPIVILPILSKVFEKAIYTRLLQYFKTQNLFNKTQHGFLKGKSTISAVFEFLENILNGLDDGMFDIGFFLDLSKAFECVELILMILKLESYGIRGLPLTLLKSYLTNRRQFVNIKNEDGECKSRLIENNTGVPQGSILAPLFFLIYVNDLIINNEDVLVTQYADDTSGNIKNKNKLVVIETAKKLIYEINIWFKKNKLQLNPSKSVVLQFQLNSWIDAHDEITFICGEQDIETTAQTNLLGIQVDKNVTWNFHIDILSKKLAKAAYAIRVLKYSINSDALITVYYAYFHSLLSYGIEIWGNAALYLTDRVFILQKRVIRIIANLGPLDSCREAFIKFKILPFPALYIYKALLFLKKNPQYFETSVISHNYNTRHKDLLNVDKHRTTAKEKGLHYSAIKFYNHLPKHLRDEQDINKFKLKLRTLLLDSKVYSIKDFFDLTFKI
jgi:hypothetical protein